MQSVLLNIVFLNFNFLLVIVIYSQLCTFAANETMATAKPVRKDTIPTLKMRLELESARERELKQRVANLSKEVEQLRDKLTTTAKATKHVYKETAASKLALKLGEMETEFGQDEKGETRQKIPHMRRKVKPNDIAKKQNAIERSSSIKHNERLPSTGLSNVSEPEIHVGPTTANHMPDLESAVPANQSSEMSRDDGFGMIAG